MIRLYLIQTISDFSYHLYFKEGLGSLEENRHLPMTLLGGGEPCCGFSGVKTTPCMADLCSERNNNCIKTCYNKIKIKIYKKKGFQVIR